MKSTILTLLLVSLTIGSASAGSLEQSYNARLVRSTEEYYTIRVGSFPHTKMDKVAELYNKMKEDGHLTFYDPYQPEDDSVWHYGVYSGCFDRPQDAHRYAGILHKRGYKCHVDTCELLSSSNDTLAIIQSPQAIWLRCGSEFRELFIFPADCQRGACYHTQPFLSPQGDEVLFEYGSRIYGIDLLTKYRHMFNGYAGKYPYEGRIDNSFPQRSPSGKYIAYIPNNIWEAWSNLCIIRNDSSAFCLVDALKALREKRESLAVKNFRWHPREDIIFCVMGYGTGTITVGGDIYGIDMEGNRRLLIECDNANREEITMDICIVRDTLFYEVAQWDETKCYFISLEQKKASVEDLLDKYYSKKAG